MSGKLNATKSSVSYIDLNKPAQTFKFVMGLCAIIFVAAVAFFSILRLKFRQIYAPRLLLIENKIFTIGAHTKSYFAWITLAFTVTDEDIYAFAGIDALVFLRFLRLVLKLALLTLPYGMIVLLPINIYGKNKLSDGLDKLSMSNVSQHSYTIWFHWFAVWLYSLIVYYLTYKEWLVYITFRQRFLKKGTGSQFAILVKNIPSELTDDSTLKATLDNLFPNKIFGVHVIKNLKNWDQLIEKHDIYVRKWEGAKLYFETENKRLMKRKCICGPQYDALQKYENELELIQEELIQEKHANHKSSQCAFVFFKSLKSRTAALQSIWDKDPLLYNVSLAPDPEEVVWHNIAYPYYLRNTRIFIGFVVVFFLVIFWAVPISFISSLSHFETVAKEFKWLDKVASGLSNIVISFIEGVLPVALLAAFYLLLPYILFFIARFQGRTSKSNMSMMVFKCLYVFQTFNTFFIYIISGSVMKYLGNIIDHPMQIPQLLAKSLPSQAGFFINYLSLSSFVGLAVEVTRLVPLILTAIKLKWIAKTQRERLDAWRPKRAEYEVMYSQALLFFLIGISYSILSPIIIPFFVIYYACAYTVWVYQLLHVYIPEYEHGGKFWPEVFYRILFCMVVFQLLMIGVFLLKGMWYCALFVSPVVLLTITYWWFVNHKFVPCGEYLALSEAGDTKYAEKKFLEDVRRRYIRDSLVPEVFEVTSDRLADIDDYIPITSMNDTDEDAQEMRENGRLLGR